MNLALTLTCQYSSFPSGVIFTETFLPPETEDGQPIKKEPFNA